MAALGAEGTINLRIAYEFATSRRHRYPPQALERIHNVNIAALVGHIQLKSEITVLSLGQSTTKRWEDASHGTSTIIVA